MKNNSSAARRRAATRDAIIFAMLGAVMLCSKLFMELLPNIHLLGVLTIAYTAVFRVKALIPIYVYVFLNGLYAGFSLWWIPYLYIWTLLWGAAMLIPKNAPKRVRAVVYPLLCALHGIAFGILYAPAQAIMYGFSLEQTLVWIAAGLPYDLLHAIGNFAVGFLILPISDILSKLYRGKYF